MARSPQARRLSGPRRALIAEIERALGPKATDLLGTPTQVARAIARFREDKLGPLEDHGPAEDAPHYAALFELGGRGTIADKTALRLAWRGFTCRRLGNVYQRLYDTDRLGKLDLDPHNQDEEARFALEDFLTGTVRHPSPTAVDRLLRSVLVSVRRQTGNPSQVVAVLGDMATLAMGGAPIEVRNPAGGEWPQHADVKPWELPPGRSPHVQIATAVKYHLADIVATVPVSNACLRHLVKMSGLSFDEQELQDLAVTWAPMEYLYLQRTAAALLAWEHTGSAWEIDFSASTPQFAMMADLIRPKDNYEDRAPAGTGALVVAIGGPPSGPRDEQLVLRRPRALGK